MLVGSTIETVARESYGRLLAFLTGRFGDWSAAEDALGEAMRIALESWSRDGIPEQPEAWLLVVARRCLSNKRRYDRRYTDVDATSLMAEAAFESTGMPSIPDERLQMLFLCAHPAIDPGLHTPLMLQAVFGLTAERIASSFLLRPATMGQRLSRAKEKIRSAGIRFTLPGPSEMGLRVNAVLEAVYAAYGTGWNDPNGSERRIRGLVEESIYLARLLAQLLPSEPEVHGLLALLLYCESRKAARRSPDGEYIPLTEQCVALWSKELISEAEGHLDRAAALGRTGRFQLEAAIQSVHSHRITTGVTDWPAIADLYGALAGFAFTMGIRVGQAAAVAEAYGPEPAIEMLDALPQEQALRYQPYWALLAHLQARMERFDSARLAYDRAIGLCEDPSVRSFLIKRAAKL